MNGPLIPCVDEVTQTLGTERPVGIAVYRLEVPIYDDENAEDLRKDIEADLRFNYSDNAHLKHL